MSQVRSFRSTTFPAARGVFVSHVADRVNGTTPSPGDAMTPDEFREHGHKLIDWIADYRATIATRPVRATTQPGEIRAGLPGEPPAEPEPFDAVIADIDAVLMPGLTHWQHPRFFGYFPANAALPSVLGDLLSSGLGVLGLNWQASPALTELEEVTCDWVRQMVGLSPAWSGVIHDTASTASLLALLCAARTRHQILARPRRDAGRAEAVHCVRIDAEPQFRGEGRAARRVRRDNVRAVPVDDAFAMRPDALEEAIRADLAAGKLPCAVVATTGTTASTALDPVGAIAVVAAKNTLWLHVDAAMAGSAMILPECRWMWEGIERADSLVFNPHKWLGAVFDCSLFYIRDTEHLIRVMSTSPSYLRTTADGQATNYRDWGIALGRRFRALKLWTLIRSEGVSGLQARLRRDIANAQWLARAGRCGTELARGCTGAPADSLRDSRACRNVSRNPRRPHASVGRTGERVRGRIPHTRGPRRAMGGARLRREPHHRARRRGSVVAGDAGGGRDPLVGRVESSRPDTFADAWRRASKTRPDLHHPPERSPWTYSANSSAR